MLLDVKENVENERTPSRSTNQMQPSKVQWSKKTTTNSHQSIDSISILINVSPRKYWCILPMYAIKYELFKAHTLYANTQVIISNKFY